ncbi:EAL domain-containing protein [Marinobacter lipolyticus]|uniref:EAL domain-containing protein n=1 Tax=Marinobacter lipolyticus TaxID=209639 RepID=UPI003A90C5F9
MDSSANPQSDPGALPVHNWRQIPRLLRRWLPLSLLVSGLVYGLTVTSILSTRDSIKAGHALPELRAADHTDHVPTEFTLQSLDAILATPGASTITWTTTPENHTGIGYPTQPATFRFSLDNPEQQATRKLLVVTAPSMDSITPAMITPDGTLERLPHMGDIHPFSNRLYDLPQWIWPVTLHPGTTTFFFEVENAGPTLLPISIHKPETILGHTAFTLAWKAFIGGLLTFALLFNISIVIMLRRPGLAWLSVLMVGVMHSQLVMDGFGLWFLWSDWPQFNALLSVSLPLCLIALCQFTPHFLSISRPISSILNVISLAALALAIVTPLGLPLPGQGSLLVLAALTGLFILAVVAGQIRHHVYARYYGLSILAILSGAIVSSMRTIGWLPVTSLSDSAFFLGAAIASLILTSGVGRLLLEERKKRLSADVRARQEGQLRAKIEKDYDHLMKTHRVTGKPNRAILEESLETLNSKKVPYTLCLIRLQRFNEIEQTLGYRTAEELLKTYLRRMSRFLERTFEARLIRINGHALASIDTINHAFAFYRGDETNSDQHIMNELTAWLGTHFREGRFAFSWSPSVGIAHAPEHGPDAVGVLSSAGFASLSGDQPLCEYDPSVAEWQYRQQMLMLDVEDALTNGSMWLEYQPKVGVRDARTSSVEALIRWHHPEFGKVPPDHWVPLAEQVGMIHPVTLWVINQACSDYKRLMLKYGSNIAVAVNISAKDLAHPRFDQEAMEILARHEMKPGELILEITETAMMADPEAARVMIHTLSQQGFRIALDDFGTGHSSLGTLASFDLDELKIDRSFLEDILDHPPRQRIFRAALELGEALDLDVVVEGVEDEAIALWLQQFPGLHGQGYYWGRPERIRADR